MAQSILKMAGDMMDFANDLQNALEAQTLSEGVFPVSVLTRLEYYMPDRPLVISPNPIIWGFDDTSPFFLRLRSYINHCRFKLDAPIVEMRIWNSTNDGVIVLQPDNRFLSNGGPPLLN